MKVREETKEKGGDQDQTLRLYKMDQNDEVIKTYEHYSPIYKPMA